MKNLDRYKPVKFHNVNIEDGFWAPKIRTNRERTIPAIYQQCKETGRIDVLKLQWKPGDEPVPHVFWDSDVAKWLEAACYSLALQPSPELARTVDEVVDLFVAAQQEDGYLNSYYTVVEPHKRWSDLRDGHELYCAGHLIEAAVAHFEATGSRKLLDVAVRYADHIGTVFGRKEGQKRGYCGHPEIELALVKLYRATREKKYLELSQYFVDERGRTPNYFDLEREARGGTPSYFDHYFQEPGREYKHEYNQSHKPVREQDKVVGHAVRAMYLYSAMADLAAETADTSLLQACERLWNHLCETQMYITGGIGSSDRNEGFTEEYDLPNETAYCETCAAVGLVFWSHRMLRMDCDRKYSDIMEKALYNGVISGVSLDGRKFFYNNPLASKGNHHRKEWFDVSCCPANLSRLLNTLGQYIYAKSDNEAIVHLYVQSSGRFNLNGTAVRLRQTTRYPWEGTVRIEVETEQETAFALKLRVPGWCRRYVIRVNGEETNPATEKGYLRIERRWKTGDAVEIEFDMPVERVYAHDRVKADRGRVALQRGPVVYCLEEADNGPDLEALSLPRKAELKAVFEPDVLGGIVTVRGEALRLTQEAEHASLYSFSPHVLRPVTLKAIPYYLWDNREPGEMFVWIREC